MHWSNAPIQQAERSHTMDLTQIRYFLAIAQHGGFTRAANELSVSQPAISRSVARLEEEIGQPLFERDSRPPKLTEAGETFRKRCTQITELVDQTVAEITDDDTSGRIRIGAIPTIAPYWLPQAISHFIKVRPRAQLLIYEEVTAKLLERIRNGELDVAILALPIDRQYLEVHKLFDEELYLMRSPNHPLANKKRVTIDDIQNYPLLLLDQSHCLSDQISAFCTQRSFHPITLERVAQLSTVQQLVSVGHGISFIPVMACDHTMTGKRLYQSIDGAKPKRTIVLVLNPYRFQSRLAKTFCREVRTRCE
jgi:LysR family transcriptional regulator, hydrogen peroxide-inducible genes activator